VLMFFIKFCKCFACLVFTILHLFGTREFIRRKIDHGTQDRSWNTNCLLVLAACHKLGQCDCVCSLHELNKSANVDEGKGSTEAFTNFLCIWKDKEQVLLNLYACTHFML
jgi:hypothetical protein